MSSAAVVIVNYRTPGLVVDCLHSLEAEAITLGLRVVVADNASDDDSASILREAIRKEEWSWAEVLPLERNGGFACGNNAAIRLLLASEHAPDYIWLLNPDTIVRPGAAAVLIDFLDGNRAVGIAGSRLEDPDGTPQTAAFRFPSLMGELEDSIRIGLVSRILSRFRVPLPPRATAHQVDWVSGASMMVRREVFEDVGLLDEKYFLYFEETDFCKRVRSAGWPIWHVPASRVVHLEGRSTGVTGAAKAAKRRPKYWFDSRARYFRKIHGATYALLADAIFIAAFGLWRIQRRLRSKPDPDPPRLWSDFVRHALRRWV